MGYVPRSPEQPRWALMLNPTTCTILCVREEYYKSKLAYGWVLVAVESDFLPFNPPRLIPDSEPLPVRRPRAQKAEQADGGDGA